MLQLRFAQTARRIAYTKATRSRSAASIAYSSFFHRAFSSQTKLYRSEFSFPELAHQIEKTEHRLHGGATHTTKELRHDFPTERSVVVAEIEAAWVQVEALSSSAPLKLDPAVTHRALDSLSSLPLDGYDLFHLETLSQNGLTTVLTDDSDFATVPGITVWTANRAVLQAANSAGKLIRR